MERVGTTRINRCAKTLAGESDRLFSSGTTGPSVVDPNERARLRRLPCYDDHILWLVHSAIPHVPAHARLSAHVIEVASARLVDAEGVYSAPLLAKALQHCEQEQPGLAAWLRRRLSRRIDDVARGLGASMAMTIWVAFSISAGSNLNPIAEEDCATVERLLHADEELRRDDPRALMESDDVIAAQQPEVAKLIRARLDETLASYADSVDVDDVDAMYQMLLVEVLVLSYAVKPVQPGHGGATSGFC